MIVKQLLVGPLDVFCYLVACETTKAAVVIDPGAESDMVFKEAQQDGLSIQYIVNTHRHNDHTAGNTRLKTLSGAKIVMHSLDAIDCSDIDMSLTSEKFLKVGTIDFQIIHTPGHTPGGICLYAEGHLFTGDTLFVSDSGRTDLPGGDRTVLGVSLRQLMQLPESTIVWPGHDYGPTQKSTIGWEKRHNLNAKEYGYFQP